MWGNALNKGFKDENLLHLEEFQKYVPIYTRFTEITRDNVDTFSPPIEKKLISVETRAENSHNTFGAKIYDTVTKKTVLQDVFFKFSPLVDPIKYTTGKYEDVHDKIFTLPGIDNEDNVYEKMLDVNNSAYVDCYFTYLTSKLRTAGFVHGMEFYGTHLGIQKNYKLNVSDDFEFMCDSEFFLKNVGNHFDVVNYDDENMCGMNGTRGFKARIDLDAAQDVEMGTDIGIDCIDGGQSTKTVFLTPRTIEAETIRGPDVAVLMSSLSDMETVDMIVPMDDNDNDNDRITLEGDEGDEGDEGSEGDDGSDDGSSCSSATTQGDCDDGSDCDEGDWSDGSDVSDGEESENIFLHVKRFPVMTICMEKCAFTYDHYITQRPMDEALWSASLFQIIMILLTYQKVYGFTHNDLHTNNIMYVETEHEYLDYVYDGKRYRVPTYGKIFKIIDFGRAIYKTNNMVFCSNSYDKGEDAYTQYNTEPYFNTDKRRIEPNMSFDLCRLGCSMFDFVVDDLEDLEVLVERDPVIALIVEWCKDDNGRNILYKASGEERYPEFKLYKMISRTVHKHLPEAQLVRPMFAQYLVSGEDGVGETDGRIVMDLDKMIG